MSNPNSVAASGDAAKKMKAPLAGPGDGDPADLDEPLPAFSTRAIPTGNGAEASMSEDENDEDVDELLDEVADLRANQDYVQFVEEIASDSPLVAEPEAEADDADPDYEPPKGDRGDEAGQGEGGAVQEEDTSSESDSDGHGELDAEEVSEVHVVEVPKVMEAEAAARFPPFWRTQRLIRIEASDSYKSEEDPDFDSEAAEVAEAAAAAAASSSSDEDDVGAEIEDEAGRLEESLRKMQEVGTAEEPMMAELAAEMNVLEIDNKEAEEMAQDDPEAAEVQAEAVEEDAPPQNVSLVEAITSFNEDGYNSAEDPDYKPEVDGMEEAAAAGGDADGASSPSSSSSSSSSEDEAEVEEEQADDKMEQ